MKRTLLLAGTLVLVVVVLGLAGCDGAPGFRVKSGDGLVSSQNSGIWVTGEGKVTVVPDVAILNVGVEVQADSVAQAQDQAATAMTAIRNELSSRGVEDKDIQTLYFNINPVRSWDPDTGEEKQTGFRVYNILTVKVRKVADTGAIIDAVANAAGNYIRIDNITFTVDDPVPYRKDARDKALADAREKAQQIADEADLDLGDPTYISETSSYPYPVPMAYEMSVPTLGGGASVSPGEMTITVQMQVAYEIE